MKRKHLIVLSFVVSFGLVFSAFLSIWVNYATSDPNQPPFLKPLLPYSWLIVLGLIVLVIIFTLWQFLYEAKNNSSSPDPTPSVPSTLHAPAPTPNQSSSTFQPSSPAQYTSCFICYSHVDKEFAERLYADLKARGVHCWSAEKDMRIGARIRYSIDEAIRDFDKLLLILSKDSIASQWVEHEVETALSKERKGSPEVVFPVCVDDAVMKSQAGWPSYIQLVRNMGDFTGWRVPGEYEKALERLVRDLKK